MRGGVAKARDERAIKKNIIFNFSSFFEFQLTWHIFMICSKFEIYANRFLKRERKRWEREKKNELCNVVDIFILVHARLYNYSFKVCDDASAFSKTKHMTKINKH